MSCCDVNGLNRIFRRGFAESDKRKFLKRGLDERQQGFFDISALEGSSILDIGCGVGVLGFTALQRGASQCQFVDVSRAYLAVAQNLSKDLNLEAKSVFLEGDFVTLATDVADTVVLDRVVCCYPDATLLLRKAAAQSQGTLLFSYPLPRWWTRLAKTLLNKMMALIRHPYRFYMHDEASLLHAAASAGHKLMDSRRYGMWQLSTFCKA